MRQVAWTWRRCELQVLARCSNYAFLGQEADCKVVCDRTITRLAWLSDSNGGSVGHVRWHSAWPGVKWFVRVCVTASCTAKERKIAQTRPGASEHNMMININMVVNNNINGRHRGRMLRRPWGKSILICRPPTQSGLLTLHLVDQSAYR